MEPGGCDLKSAAPAKAESATEASRTAGVTIAMERWLIASSVRCLAINAHTTIEWLKAFCRPARVPTSCDLRGASLFDSAPPAKFPPVKVTLPDAPQSARHAPRRGSVRAVGTGSHLPRLIEPVLGLVTQKAGLIGLASPRCKKSLWVAGINHALSRSDKNGATVIPPHPQSSRREPWSFRRGLGLFSPRPSQSSTAGRLLSGLGFVSHGRLALPSFQRLPALH